MINEGGEMSVTRETGAESPNYNETGELQSGGMLNENRNTNEQTTNLAESTSATTPENRSMEQPDRTSSMNFPAGSGLSHLGHTTTSPQNRDINYLNAGPSGSHHSAMGTDDSGLFALPERDPENPITFKSALEFIPKYFDGKNIPVGRFVRDCIYARNSIAAKDRQHLFLIIRSRITGSAYDALMDRDVFTLEGLLKALKNKYTAHRNLSQLQSILATISQKPNEKVSDYGDRVGNVLKNLIEVIEETNSPEAAAYMISSARYTARENFLMGLRYNLILRVRMEKPETLQDAISVARGAEWEAEYTKNLTQERKERNDVNLAPRGLHADRFRPYRSDARVHLVKEEQEMRAGIGRGSNLRGRDGGAAARGRGRGGWQGASTMVSCRTCGGPGHLGGGCPKSPSSSSKSCYRCAKPGHLAQDCPSANTVICFNCSQQGHYARDCPQTRRTDVKGKSCRNCKNSGHEIGDCPTLNKRIEEGKREKNADLNVK